MDRMFNRPLGRVCLPLAWSFAAVAALVMSGPGLAAPSTASVRFSRDIRPILSENCTACHGPDANKRKAALRLDTRDGLFEKTPKRGPAVVPGRLDQSELWQRVIATDPDDVMPPPDTHKVLTAEQKELLRRWIQAGAPWEGHWAYLKPEKAPVPAVKAGGFMVRNPIDAFVLGKLQAN